MAALVTILSDPANESRSAEELAGLILDRVYDLAVSTAKAEVRAETRQEIFDKDSQTRRLAVVGQISYGPQEPTHTVVLGPFSARGILDSEEKFQRATEGGTAAREVGQHLAWDSKTNRGRGRFMLAPAFMKPRDAWDFYRGADPAQHIVQALTESRPLHLGPVCTCGLQEATACRWCSRTYKRHCPLHDAGAEVHQCRAAA